jgi:hypothetical protein
MVQKERKMEYGMDGKKAGRKNRKTEHGYREGKGENYERMK